MPSRDVLRAGAEDDHQEHGEDKTREAEQQIGRMPLSSRSVQPPAMAASMPAKPPIKAAATTPLTLTSDRDAGAEQHAGQHIAAEAVGAERVREYSGVPATRKNPWSVAE